MGVRGLTGFIARHAELYMSPYELHDCNLVIDGDNLACSLHKDVTGTNSAFGGDYDDFYRAVVNFFLVLAECNINSFVLMDGGYEHRKLRTVGKRMRGKISAIKRINPCMSTTVFPLMMKEVFVDAVKDCGVPVMRCVFEADDELASLSRKLKCPVLSYDSDFYIHNVKYIPLITLTVKAQTKYIKSVDQKNLKLETRNLRKTEAKNIKKRTRTNRIMGTIVVNNKEKHRKGNSYKYLDCCMYRIENLTARISLSKEKLPLFAALLGNDYISRSSFKNFFLNGMGKIGRSRKTNQQQRRIKAILQWMKTETAESALLKIVTRLKKDQRESLIEQVEAATSGYSNEKCRSFDYFLNKFENIFDYIHTDDETNDEEKGSDSEVEYFETDEETEFEYDEEIGEEQEVEESNEELEEQLNYETSLEETENDEQPKDTEIAQTADENKNDVISTFPLWLTKKLYPANLPRFFVDLVHLRKYINNPQIEHFPFDDCHSIALPILSYIYSLINNVIGEEYVPKEMKDGKKQHLSYTYLTRAKRVTQIIYKQVEVEEKPKYEFVPEAPNPLLFRAVFESIFSAENLDKLFTEIENLPQDLKLYFLAIIYWLQSSQHYDVVHLQSLIVCLVVLRTIDSKIPPERNSKIFKKKFGNIIKRERQIREKEVENGTKRQIKEELLALPMPERLKYIQKSDCILVQNEILKYFHMKEIFKKKYDLYSSTILHAFGEFQSVVFQLHSLNALLDFPYSSPHMGQLYCGVFLYNLYDLFISRSDIEYYIRNFIFKDSQMMFDFYLYLWQWCEKFIPPRKQTMDHKLNTTVSKKVLKKKRQQARKKDAQENVIVDPNADILSSSGEMTDEFIDLNNKFCAFLTK